MSGILIRDAVEGDLEGINSIYNEYVLSSTCTYQTEPETMEARRAWFAAHGAAHPVNVAVEGSQVLGWGSLSPFHRRSAYSRTVENSVYVDRAQQRRGIGRALLTDLIERAAGLGHHAIIALIDAEQTPSIALHEALGFVRAGHLHEVGFKFGRWLDVIYMEKRV